MTFGKWLLTGLLLAILIIGLIGFFSTHDPSALGMTVFALIAVGGLGGMAVSENF